jgi:hypothetical protein
MDDDTKKDGEEGNDEATKTGGDNGEKKEGEE